MPAGTVTFLFTDIEGSTRLWEEHPAAMKAALAVHDGILRAAVEEHGGRVVKTTGDGLHAVFAVADEAVAAAGAAQLGLGTTSWDATGPLRVRMGLHTGSAELRGGDYYGPALNRAARLMAAAHGGQILVSHATADLVWDAPSESVGLLDLGEHRLRDLGRAEHVFQVTCLGLELEFPALRTLDAFPGNLPAQLTEFVGRDEELRAVTKLVSDGRIVTLTGPGGVGKTRLALQAAADSIGGFRDGAWFVDLASVDEPSLVGATVALALQIPEPRQGGIEDALVAALRHRRTLIVLDNCEHLVDSAASFAEMVARECGDVTILATSREAFGLVGEDTYPVKPLAVPPAGPADVGSLRANDAVRLFVDRAVSARHGFVLTSENASAVGELCRRLDGIPLAIELAAARVQSMSPSDIVDRLNERFRLLARGRRSGLARHQTLRGAVDWSYELLESPEQLVFQRCSVFTGGFTLEAAEDVVGGESVAPLDVVDLVSGLVNKSMILVDDAGARTRYRMLETLRDYSAERLAESGGTGRVRNRHSLYYLGVAECLGPRLLAEDPEVPRQELDDEYDNMRAALACSDDTAKSDVLLRLVRALEPYWQQRGMWREALSWILTARADTSDDTPANVRAWLDGFAGYFATQRGGLDEAIAWLRSSVELTDAAGEPPIPATVMTLALEALEGNRPAEAVAYAEQALDVARRRRDRYWECEGLIRLALMIDLTQEGETQGDLADQGVELARALRNDYLIAHALISVGIARFRADPAGAISVFDEAVRIGTELLMPSPLVQASFFRALSHVRLGDLEPAVQDLISALEQAQILGNDYFVAMVLGAAAGILSREITQQDTAVRLLGAADRLNHTAGVVGAPRDVKMQERIKDRLQHALAPDAYEHAWRLGRQMALEEVVTLAQANLTQLASNQS